MLRFARLFGLLSGVLALAAGATACGGSAGRRAPFPNVVVRIEGTQIDGSMLTHWMSLLAPQHVVPEPPHYATCIIRLRALEPYAAGTSLKNECITQRQTLTHQALDVLISSEWLIQEAAARGLGVSHQEVMRRLAQRKSSFPNGAAEFEESLKATDHTSADLEFELETELAAEKIRQWLIAGEARLSPLAIARYYHNHIKQYHVSETRHIYIAENLKSAATARKLVAELVGGRPFSTVTDFFESFQRREIANTQGEKRTILEAIFAAKPHTIATPVELNHLYFVFEVTSVVPSYVRSLAQVRQSIASKLIDKHQRATLSRFITGWRARWIARTTCSPGAVVQKCSHYGGQKATEDQYSFT